MPLAPEKEAEFIQARQMMRNMCGANYGKRIADYKGMLTEVMNKFKMTPLMACEHCIKELDQPHHKDVDPENLARALFLSAAFDMIEERNN